jgi:hypothetical protein
VLEALKADVCEVGAMFLMLPVVREAALLLPAVRVVALMLSAVRVTVRARAFVLLSLPVVAVGFGQRFEMR